MTKKTQDFVALKQVLAEILGEICTLTNCQSVGIRLENNGDYPYYVYEGFPDFFILKENRICTKDDNGNYILDENGSPFLECICGDVLKGKFDPKLPYFTEKGSFWTNSTTRLLGTTTDKKILGRIRNMCHNSGYESVALILMQADNRTLGLIQMNDPRENMFTPKMIENCEVIADRAGAVVVNAIEIQERIKDVFDLLDKLNSNKG
jgi:hypothetical protein